MKNGYRLWNKSESQVSKSHVTIVREGELP